METIKIINSSDYASEHFRFSEWFATSLSPTRKEFECPKCLIQSAEILRAFFNENWLITSAYRPNDTFGFHRTGNAFDSVPFTPFNRIRIINKFHDECIKYQQDETSQLIRDLRSVGVQGIGVEPTCVHLDYRNNENCVDTDKYGKYIVFRWDGKNSTVIYKHKG